MKIGELKTTDQGASYTGSLRTIAWSGRICFEQAAAKRDDNSPDYNVFAITPDGELVAIGNAWRKRTTANNRELAFLSVTMDDPSWEKPLNVAAFPSDGDPTKLEIQWRRERQDRRAA